MVDLWRDFWIRVTGTGQQVAQLHDRYMMMMMMISFAARTDKVEYREISHTNTNKSTPRSSKRSLSFKLTHQNPVCTSPPPQNVPHAPPISFFFFNRPYNQIHHYWNISFLRATQRIVNVKTQSPINPYLDSHKPNPHSCNQFTLTAMFILLPLSMLCTYSTRFAKERFLVSRLSWRWLMTFYKIQDTGNAKCAPLSSNLGTTCRRSVW
jgi:hypothetical protein